MPVISSNQRKPLFLTLAIGLFCTLFFLWPLKAPLSHPSLANHPNLTPTNGSARVKAAFVILTRNNELDPLRRTIQQLEARFNHKFNYPYVFLNDEEFTQEFKELTTSLTNAETKYGKIV
jgi:alpha 1,2-mannosyltransferase